MLQCFAQIVLGGSLYGFAVHFSPERLSRADTAHSLDPQKAAIALYFPLSPRM